MILQQKKLRLVNYETSSRNLDSSSGIYRTYAKVAQCILVSENRREKVEAKRKQKIIQPPKSCIFNKSYLDFSEKVKTP